MKKIQTPMISSIGNQEIRIESSGCMPSSSGAAVTLTFLSISRGTRFGSSPGFWVANTRPSVMWPVMLLPLIVTSLTWLALTCWTKSE